MHGPYPGAHHPTERLRGSEPIASSLGGVFSGARRDQGSQPLEILDAGERLDLRSRERKRKERRILHHFRTSSHAGIDGKPRRISLRSAIGSEPPRRSAAAPGQVLLERLPFAGFAAMFR
jgi:hypothetical protein